MLVLRDSRNSPCGSISIILEVGFDFSRTSNSVLEWASLVKGQKGKESFGDPHVFELVFDQQGYLY